VTDAMIRTVPIMDWMPSAVKSIPAFVGMKYTNANIIELQQVHNAFEGTLKIMPGSADVS